jgi:hypothetical protein
LAHLTRKRNVLLRRNFLLTFSRAYRRREFGGSCGEASVARTYRRRLWLQKGVLTLPHSLSKYKEARAILQTMFWFLSNVQRLTCSRLLVLRFTISMGALAFIPHQKELQSLLGSTGSDPGVFGTRRFATAVERIWQIDA